MRRMIALLLLLLAGPAFAHNGLEHVMGTVLKMTATRVDVKTVAGKTTSVVLVATTRWVRGTMAVTAKDIKPGDRVVIHAKPSAGTLTAVEVSVGEAPAKH